MKAIIVGAGEVGFHIAKRWPRKTRTWSSSTAIRQCCSAFSNTWTCRFWRVPGAARWFWVRPGITKADVLLAVTDSDEINLMACTFANMLSPGLTKLARIRNDEYIAYGQQLASSIGIGIIINPEVEVVRTIVHMLRAPGAVDISDLAGGRIKLAGTWITEGNPLVGTRLLDLRRQGGRYTHDRGGHRSRRHDHRADRIRRDPQGRLDLLCL